MAQQRPYRGVAADERQERRRVALLEAALDCLGSDDGAVSVRAVCHRARLTTRYFYESFSSLDQLLVTLVTQIADEVAEGGMAALRERRSRRLYYSCRAAFEGAYEVLLEDRRKARAMLVVAAGTEGLQEARRRIVFTYVEAMLSTLGGEIGDAVGSAPARVAVLFAVGGALELMNAVLNGDVQLSDDELADEVARLLASSIRQIRTARGGPSTR